MVRRWRAAPPDHHLFAYEQPSSSSGGKNYMEFHLLSLDQLIAHQRNIYKPRRWQESIHPDQMLKLMIDIDRDGWTFEQGEAERVLLQQEVAARLEARLGITPCPEPLILDATIPEKYSVHLIYPIWFESPRHVHQLLHQMPFAMDNHPYPLGTTNVWMRMAFSKKVGKENCLVPRWRPDVGVIFNLEVFCQTSITLWSESEKYRHLLPKPTTVYALELLPLYQGLGGGGGAFVSESPAHDSANRILNYIKRMVSCDSRKIRFTKLQVKQNGSWECTVSPPLFCANKGRQHKSHNMYIGSKDSMRVWYLCPDPDCRTTVYLPMDFTDVAYPNRPSDALLEQAARSAFPDLQEEEEEEVKETQEKRRRV